MSSLIFRSQRKSVFNKGRSINKPLGCGGYRVSIVSCLTLCLSIEMLVKNRSKVRWFNNKTIQQYHIVVDFVFYNENYLKVNLDILRKETKYIVKLSFNRSHSSQLFDRPQSEDKNFTILKEKIYVSIRTSQPQQLW